MPDLTEGRPPPSWLGDITDGVDAWTQRASTPPGEKDPRPAEEGAQRPSRDRTGSRSRSRSGDGSGRSSRGRGRGERRSTPPPEDTAAAVPPADPEAVARKILLDQLTGQARSRKELADKLAAKLVPDDVATRLLDRFEEVGLIDDEAYARAWIASRGSARSSGGGRGLARRALAQELRRKGVEDEVAREALDEIDPADEEEAARVLVRKKLRSLARVDDTTATRRLVGMLARKGYGAGLAFSVVREELAQADRAEATTD